MYMENIVKLGAIAQLEKAQEIAVIYKEVFGCVNQTTKRIATNFIEKMGLPGANCFIAIVRKKVVGFTWGYKIIDNDILEKYLKAPGLSELLGKETYFLFDKLVVLPEYRNQGIGRRLVTSLCYCGNTNPVVLRTRKHSPTSTIIAIRRGKAVLKIGKKSVIMIINYPHNCL